MRTIEWTWDRNEKENIVSKCFASLCFSETLWRTYNDKKKTSATNDNKLHYILNRIRIPIDAERNTLSWENPHKKYQRHFISHAGFFPFVRWLRLFEFASLDCWFSSQSISSLCMLVQIQWRKCGNSGTCSAIHPLWIWRRVESKVHTFGTREIFFFRK